MTNKQPEVHDWAQWRRDIHSCPELGFEEHVTSKKVAECLDALGIETHTGIGQTGVVGVLRRGTSSRSIGLRADLDALPIQEENRFAHRSKNDGKFHGCGHDGHTTMLMNAAANLVKKDSIDGTVHFIFQPNEENGLGALAMMKDGLFDRFAMDAVYGLHNMPGIPAGAFAVRKGSMMTFEDNFVIRIVGRGGHASMPHKTIDAAVIAAEIIMALQTIVGRSLDPMKSGVVSVTDISTDGARNVIPTTVTIKGDTRGLLDETQDLIERRMRQIVQNIGAAHGAEVTLEYTNEFVVLSNSDEQTEIAAAAAREVVGSELVDDDCLPCHCSEDFAQMLRAKPGCYILIGNGTEGAVGQPLHNPHYDFNDDLISIGASYWTKLAETVLCKSGSAT